MPEIVLYELGPTRSARCRWTLLEAGLPFESRGNSPDILGSEELRRVHPLGKLPAITIDGRPLFESAAIATAIADLVPERGLIAPSGSWQRALHDQWVCFALTELEAWAWSSELNMMDFVLSKEQHVPAILPQNANFYRNGAKVLEQALARQNYLIDDRFSVTDIIVCYAVHFGQELGLLEGFPNVQAYLQRLYDQEHCTLDPLPLPAQG